MLCSILPHFATLKFKLMLLLLFREPRSPHETSESVISLHCLVTPARLRDTLKQTPLRRTVFLGGPDNVTQKKAVLFTEQIVCDLSICAQKLLGRRCSNSGANFRLEQQTPTKNGSSRARCLCQIPLQIIICVCFCSNALENPTWNYA